jgi:RNA polymerase sigma factor (sigma-70 family)
MNAIHADAACQNAESAATGAVAAIDVNKLYREHRHHLMRFVQRYVRRHEDAEDVVQNTFVEAVRCADHFAGLSKPSTWLFGIALNLARNHVRRGYLDANEPLDETILSEMIDVNADPAMLVELREIASKVDMLLDRLHPDIRMTFEAVLEGASTYEKTAEELNIPVGTVRSRVSRVRSVVRSEFMDA